MKIIVVIAVFCCVGIVALAVLAKRNGRSSTTAPVAYSATASWVVTRGGDSVEKKARKGVQSLTSWERLVYCLWVADYGMRNAGDLDTARDVYANFQSEGQQLAKELSLRLTHEAFSLSKGDFEREYFSR